MDLMMIKNNKGMSALLTVVIIGVSTVIMAVSSSLLSIGELEMGVHADKASESLYLADGCLENVLRKIQINESYIASDEIITIGEGRCIVNIVAVGDNRAITIEGVLGNYRKKISVGAIINGKQIIMNTWEVIN